MTNADCIGAPDWSSISNRIRDLAALCLAHDEIEAGEMLLKAYGVLKVRSGLKAVPTEVEPSRGDRRALPAAAEWEPDDVLPV